MNLTPQQVLVSLIGHIDYTNGCCRLVCPVAAAIDIEALKNAREVAMAQPEACHIRRHILTILDQIDYTAMACNPLDMIGACLPKEVLVNAKKAAEEVA